MIAFDPSWAEPGQLVRIVGRQLKWTAQPQVFVGGVPAQVLSAAANQVSFRVPATATSGPVEIAHEGGRVALTGQFPVGVPQVTHPGFFLVTGPSIVTQVVKPAGLAAGSVLTVTGQNLARLGGICLAQANGLGYVGLSRTDLSNSWLTSNTEMQVKMEFPPSIFGAAPVQLFISSQPVGDFPPNQFVCGPNAQAVPWP